MDSVEDFGPSQITPDETEPIPWWTDAPKCLDIITSITFNTLQSFVERVFQAVLRPTEKLTRRDPQLSKLVDQLHRLQNENATSSRIEAT